MSTDGQGTKRRRNTAENVNRLSRVHERYRQQTDGRATAYSERSLKAVNQEVCFCVSFGRATLQQLRFPCTVCCRFCQIITRHKTDSYGNRIFHRVAVVLLCQNTQATLLVRCENYILVAYFPSNISANIITMTMSA